MRSAHFLVLLLFLAGSCAAGPGKVLRSGLCEREAGATRYDQPQSAAGYASTGELHITTETSIVPLRKDIGFGFEWEATGLPDELEVEFVIRSPRIKKPDGMVLTSFTERLPMISVGGMLTSTDCYFLAEEHELVAGKWSITVRFNGKTLVSRQFDVRVQK